MTQSVIEQSEMTSDPVDSQGERGAQWELYETLAGVRGTPCYVYEAGEVEKRARELHSIFPASASSRLFYSFKANPLPSLAREARRSGCEAELTSLGEITAAREAGYDLTNALYGGPGKSKEEWIAAIQAGLVQFSIESSRDLAVLDEAASFCGVEVRVLLRINPSAPPRAKLAMSGVASQFGFEEEDLRSAGPELWKGLSEAVKVVGFHLYWGTQIASPAALLASFERTVELARELRTRLEIPLEILNLGGGFPWPYAHSGDGPNLEELGEALAELHARSSEEAPVQWWFESGRHLVASSGTLLTRVMEVKRSKGERLFLILDTGIHHLGGMAGLGRIPRFSIDMIVPPERRGGDAIVVDVVGQLCTPLDCIGKKINLPQVEPGDLIAIPNVGAYGPTASVSGFLSRPAPAEILHRDGEVLSIHQLRIGHETIL